MVSLLIKRYFWLIDTLRRSGTVGLTLAEINEAWSNPYNQLYKDCGCEGISRRTLLNHRYAIEEQLHIDIECVRAGAMSRYKINTELQEENPLVEWMLSAISTENLVSEYSNMADKILLEPADNGSKYLTTITQALKFNKRLVIDYQSFHIGKQLQTKVVIEPLALKMFKRRWYLLCCRVEGGVKRIYALDRIKCCDITEEQFNYPQNFSPAGYFNDFFGVSTDGYTKMPCRVVLRAYRELPRYLITQPLHSSQELIGQTEEYAEFSYWLTPAFDFVQEILLHGDQLEVVSPKHLREHMKSILENSYRNYL